MSKPTLEEDIDTMRTSLSPKRVEAAGNRVIAKALAYKAKLREQENEIKAWHDTSPETTKIVRDLRAKLREAERESKSWRRVAERLEREKVEIRVLGRKAEARAGRLAEALSLVAANTSDVHILKVADAALREARREET